MTLKCISRIVDYSLWVQLFLQNLIFYSLNKLKLYYDIEYTITTNISMCVASARKIFFLFLVVEHLYILLSPCKFLCLPNFKPKLLSWLSELLLSLSWCLDLQYICTETRLSILCVIVQSYSCITGPSKVCAISIERRWTSFKERGLLVPKPA